jgi:hypothetical protein
MDAKNVIVQKLLNAIDFDCQHGMFKLTMKSNATTCMVTPFNTNPLTRIWCLVTRFQILPSNFPEYMKLVELAML